MRLGQFELRVVSGGQFKMDGGAMFGVVPKSMWCRYAAPDGENLIQQASNCLLIESGGQRVLVDTGYGGKLTEKQQSYLAAESGMPLLTSLSQLDVAAEDIDVVVLTHLHFDHAGGGTSCSDRGDLVPTFPNAEYVVQRREWTLATADLPELRGAYSHDNLSPLHRTGCLRLVDGSVEVVPGVRVILTSGHTLAHQSVVVESEGSTAIYLGDLCPSAAHLPVRWGMSYDLDVLQLRRTRMEVLGRIADHGWWALFDHDPCVTHAQLQRDEKRDFAILEPANGLE